MDSLQMKGSDNASTNIDFRKVNSSIRIVQNT